MEYNDTFTTVKSGVMPPAFRYPDYSDERAFLNLFLDEPIKTRYVKFIADSFYKMQAALGTIQLFSTEPVPTVNIQSLIHTENQSVTPGLRCETFNYWSSNDIKDIQESTMDQLSDHTPSNMVRFPILPRHR